ncbi:MAG: c-type cytochrome [Pseudomonadota bacterium]|nr:c-type cytochrome [Pseudomonadota bacterium]MDP1904302.1 c-type cytochrome [Pseudomonadota bacterium]MDP2351836.1 c-type cytochrome [Pseudomonadota bacterium]
MKLHALITGLLLAATFGANSWATSPAPATAGKGDATKAQKIVNDVCAGCHSADGNSTSPAYPSLASQSPEYLAKQLNEFKSGARMNAIMAPNVTKLSADDMLNLAAYFSAQQPKPRQAKDASLIAEGQKLYKGGNAGSGVPACASCHGPSGAGIPTLFPRLAGQHSKYVLTQLKNFRSGDRSNDGGKMMQVIAKKMTDQEMKAVAEYVNGLR